MSCGCTYTHSCLLSSATKTASCDCRDCGKYIYIVCMHCFCLLCILWSLKKMIVKIWYHAVINFMVNFFSAVMLGNFPLSGGAFICKQSFLLNMQMMISESG